jgi:hypothetical protein
MASVRGDLTHGRRSWIVLTIAILGPAAVAIGLASVRASVASSVAALVLVLLVAGAGLLVGRGPGALSGLLAALCFDLLLVTPYGSLAIDDPEYAVAVVVMAVAGFGSGQLMTSLRSERRLRRRREAELVELRTMLELGAAGEPPGRLVAAAVAAVRAVTGVPCQFEASPFLDRLPELHHSSLVVPAGDRGPLATPDLVQVPVMDSGRVLGRLVLELGRPVPSGVLVADTRESVTAIADQLGRALAVTAR